MANKQIPDLTNYTPAVDVDVLPIVDTTTATIKKITWANVKATLKTYFDTLYPAETATTIKTALGITTLSGSNTGDQDLSTLVPKTTTVNGHALSSNVTVTASDLSLGNVDNTSDATKNAATATLTNKRINPRIVTAASYTTDTGTSLDVSTCDLFVVTAQAGALKLNNPGGTPTEGHKLIVRIKDNGSARALTYDTQFRAVGTALPSTTVLSKTLYLGFIYNSTDTKWDLVAAAQEA